jgi:hypothetical protein
VISLGGEVIPGIWEHSLTQWQHHVGSQTGNGDLLHWCLYKANSVPAFWNSKLYELLLKGKDDIPLYNTN